MEIVTTILSNEEYLFFNNKYSKLRMRILRINKYIYHYLLHISNLKKWQTKEVLVWTLLCSHQISAFNMFRL